MSLQWLCQQCPEELGSSSLWGAALAVLTSLLLLCTQQLFFEGLTAGAHLSCSIIWQGAPFLRSGAPGTCTLGVDRCCILLSSIAIFVTQCHSDISKHFHCNHPGKAGGGSLIFKYNPSMCILFLLHLMSFLFFCFSHLNWNLLSQTKDFFPICSPIQTSNFWRTGENDWLAELPW